MNRILLHTCCAPCSAAIIEWLLQENIQPVIYFYNPNIYPYEEYLIRKKELIGYVSKLGLEVVDGDYNHANWLDAVAGFENEPERGKRCLACFKERMLAVARMAEKMNLSHFTTTLASSRWKSLEQIGTAAQWAVSQVNGVDYMDKNWRKGGLSERRRQLLEEHKFYNQNWCGCEFSLRK